MWEGPPPEALKDLDLSPTLPDNPQQTLLIRLLTQKLEEVARIL